MKVLVLYGGASPERRVSLDTGRAVAAALEGSGHAAALVDPWGEGGALGLRVIRSLLDAIETESPDVVFVALHGGDGEDGTIQALLDLARVSYTGSGVVASAVAMDKALSKELFRRAGVSTADWRVVSAPPDVPPGALGESARPLAERLGYPLVVKPNAGGSTVGVSIVREAGALERALVEARRHDDRILLETYIAGRELTVAILDGDALPIVEIVPESGFYDYEAKYESSATRYVVPAEVDRAVGEALTTQALDAYRVIGCAGVVRADFRLSPENVPYCLELNTVPGLTATSLVPKAARAAGIEFPALVERLCNRGRSERPTAT